MEFLKKNASALVWCVIEIIFGILLLVDSADFIRILAIIVGVILAVGGVMLTVTYFVTKPKEAKGKYLFTGLTYLACGIVLCVKSEWLSTLINVILVLLAVVLFVDSFQKIQEVCDKIRLKEKKWIAPLIGAVVEIVLAILLLVLDSQRWVLITLGILIIVEAVYNIFVLIFLGRTHDAIKEAAAKDEKEVIDVDDGNDKVE